MMTLAATVGYILLLMVVFGLVAYGINLTTDFTRKVLRGKKERPKK